jgi:hypothetical protein
MSVLQAMEILASGFAERRRRRAFWSGTRGFDDDNNVEHQCCNALKKQSG